MNKLSVLLLICLIKLSLSVECDRYLVSVVVVPATTRTYTIDLYSRDITCDVPLIVDDTVDTTTVETLTLNNRKMIKVNGKVEEYSIQIDSINVSYGYPYCRKYFKLGNDVDYPIGQGNGTLTPWNLVENYTLIDDLNVKDIENPTISTYVSINQDKSYQFKIISNQIQSLSEIRSYNDYITSDKQPDGIVLHSTVSTTYDIADDPTFGTYGITSAVSDGGELTSSFNSHFYNEEYINYNIFSNGTESCWLGYIDTKKYHSSVYADCSLKDGNLKTTNIEVNNKYELDVVICRQLLSTGTAFVNDNTRRRLVVVFDISVTDYTFPTDYYEAVKTAAPKISFNLYPVKNDYCLVNVIQPSDDTKTLTCTMSSAQMGNPDIYFNFLSSSFSSVLYDYGIYIISSCDTIDIICTTTVVSSLNVLSPLSFKVIDPDNLNGNKTLTSFGTNYWEHWRNLDSWSIVSMVFIILLVIIILWWLLKKLFRCFTCLPCRQIKACWDKSWLSDKRFKLKNKNGEVVEQYEITTMDVVEGENGDLGKDTEIKLSNMTDEQMMKEIERRKNIKYTKVEEKNMRNINL